MADTGSSCRADGLVERRAQQRSLNKVIEMPSLEGSVLPIVGEAQQLARLLLQSGLA